MKATVELLISFGKPIYCLSDNQEWEIVLGYDFNVEDLVNYEIKENTIGGEYILITDVRPTRRQKDIGYDEGWGRFEISHGYGVFQDGENDFQYIAKIDVMEVFSSDEDAVEQAKKDGFVFLKVTKKDIEDSEGVSLTNILDTPLNREILAKKRRDS